MPVIKIAAIVRSAVDEFSASDTLARIRYQEAIYQKADFYMRGSILYPDRHRAIMTGIITMGAFAFLAGALGILNPRLRAWTPEERWEVPLDGMGFDETVDGVVYWLNEKDGRLSIVGEFKTGADGGTLTLTSPENFSADDILVRGEYWPRQVSSYAPYVQFVFDDDLQTRLRRIHQRAQHDATVRVKQQAFLDVVVQSLEKQLGPRAVQDILGIPGVRQWLLDSMLRRGAGWLHGDGPEIPDEPPPTRRRPAPPGLTDYFHEQFGKWIDAFPENREAQTALENLMEAYDPYFRSALHEIVWISTATRPKGREQRPNARVLWVARRLLFGGRTPAILLVEDPGRGVPLTEAPLVIETIR